MDTNYIRCIFLMYNAINNPRRKKKKRNKGRKIPRTVLVNHFSLVWKWSFQGLGPPSFYSHWSWPRLLSASSTHRASLVGNSITKETNCGGRREVFWGFLASQPYSSYPVLTPATLVYNPGNYPVILTGACACTSAPRPVVPPARHFWRPFWNDIASAPGTLYSLITLQAFSGLNGVISLLCEPVCFIEDCNQIVPEATSGGKSNCACAERAVYYEAIKIVYEGAGGLIKTTLFVGLGSIQRILFVKSPSHYSTEPKEDINIFTFWEEEQHQRLFSGRHAGRAACR